MSVLTWCSWRSGGIAMILLLLFSYYVLSKEYAASHHDSATTAQTAEGGGAWTIVLAYYCLLSHVLVFIFPLRANWAFWDITKSLRAAARSQAFGEFKAPQPRRGSSASISSAETLIPTQLSSRSSEAGDATEYYEDDADFQFDSVIHAIVIPNYKEEDDTLRETLQVLASHPRARSSYDVYLGMEQREPDAELKAMRLVSEFAKDFRSLDFTIHPSDIPGESAGKGSNVAWATRVLSERYPLGKRKNVLVTGIDADSHLSANYFTMATNLHLAHPATASTTMYSAPIIFDRNAHNIPAVVRVGDILWSAAGISGLYRGSSIAPPTSVYTLPLELVDRVGGWDCGPEAIGEDLHMYLKCFFALNGNLTTRTILSPVSQTNVTAGGHGKGINGFIRGAGARYKQAQRHMWGVLDFGFALQKFGELWKDRKCLARVFRPLHLTTSESAGSYIPEDTYIGDSEFEQQSRGGIFSDVTYDTLKSPDYVRLYFLFNRLFEAHLLPVQTAILIFASAFYLYISKDRADIYGINWIFSICAFLRVAGVALVALLLFQYERFHRICLEVREREMINVGLADGMNFSRRQMKSNIVDYFMVPLVAPLYGSIPCAQAQICHFWTLDLVYTVSKKATREKSPGSAAAIV